MRKQITSLKEAAKHFGSGLHMSMERTAGYIETAIPEPVKRKTRASIAFLNKMCIDPPILKSLRDPSGNQLTRRAAIIGWTTFVVVPGAPTLAVAVYRYNHPQNSEIASADARVETKVTPEAKLDSIVPVSFKRTAACYRDGALITGWAP